MNTKSAIENIEAIRSYLTAGNPMWNVEVVNEACDKAIEALKQTEWIPCEKRLPDEYGEYRITWTTSASKKRFVGDAEYEITSEWDDEHYRFKGEWLLDDYIKNYPDVKVIAWKPIEEPYKTGEPDEQDITYCLNHQCINNRCEHNQKRIENHGIDHEYKLFNDCEWWKVREEGKSKE